MYLCLSESIESMFSLCKLFRLSERSTTEMFVKANNFGNYIFSFRIENVIWSCFCKNRCENMIYRLVIHYSVSKRNEMVRI